MSKRVFLRIAYDGTNYHGWQTEIKTAAFSQPALHIEQTDLEQIIRLAIFFNDALTVHQSKATSFVLPQFLLVGSVTHTDGFRVIYFFSHNAGYIFR